jgi:hypothetical protein
MQKRDMKIAIDAIGGNTFKPMERLTLAKEMAAREDKEFQERVTEKYRQNALEREKLINDNLKKNHEEVMKNVPLINRGNSFDDGKTVVGEPGALNKTLASGVGLDNQYLNQGQSIDSLPKFKPGTDIAPIIAIIR